MLVIMKNALKERLRRKELYIIVVIGVLLFLLCSSESMTISVEGKALTGFENMFVILHIAINAVGCILAAVLSINTIPNEYERRNSHLIWVRGVSQKKYHTGLALANMISSIMATLVLYMMLVIFTMIKGDGQSLINLFLGFLMVSVNIGIISILTSVMSIVMPGFAAGTIGIIVALIGIFHAVLDLYKSMAGGVAGGILNVLLHIVPDLHGLQSQAQNIIMGKSVDVYFVFAGLLALYVCTIGLIVFKRKEA